MREALNENPVVQIAIVGLLAVAVGFLLMTRVAGGGGSEEPTGEPSSAAEEVVAAPEPGTDGAGTASGGVEAPATGTAATAPTGEFAAGPGLPARVVSAHEDGKAVVVLVTRERGIEDKRLRSMISRIEGVGDVAVFHAYARDIAEYSRITGGVGVSRVPALVVVRPQGHGDGGTPVASVSYGFRGPASAEQSVRDALYDGAENLPYHPR